MNKGCDAEIPNALFDEAAGNKWKMDIRGEARILEIDLFYIMWNETMVKDRSEQQ